MTRIITNFTTNVLERIKLAYELQTDRSLCNRLKIKPNTLSQWKTRDTIDLKIVLSACEDLNYDWVVKGIGNIFSEHVPNAPEPKDIPKEHIITYIKDYWTKADDDERSWFKVQFMKSFPDYKDWLASNKLL
ncbi:MAG: helix-turn-helix domain-containing protein [Nitrospirae bacterium]|nr:helix-turn-helix domain-containing protein [Nitrospirota bacterium]